MLKGNLADFPLVGVLQMLRNASRTGTLHITHQRGGLVGVEKGKIIHARAGRSSAERALAILASVDVAPFEFTAEAPTERTIDSSTDFLLADVAKETIFWTDLGQEFHWNQIPYWQVTPGPMDFERLQVSSLIDGQRSLEGIMQAANIAPRRVAEVVLEFERKGLIAFREPSGNDGGSVELFVSSIFTANDATVYVDQGLYDAWVRNDKLSVKLTTDWGTQGIFEAKGRRQLEGIVQVPEVALRKLRLPQGLPVMVALYSNTLI